MVLLCDTIDCSWFQGTPLRFWQHLDLILPFWVATLSEVRKNGYAHMKSNLQAASGIQLQPRYTNNDLSAQTQDSTVLSSSNLLPIYIELHAGSSCDQQVTPWDSENVFRSE